MGWPCCPVSQLHIRMVRRGKACKVVGQIPWAGIRESYLGGVSPLSGPAAAGNCVQGKGLFQFWVLQLTAAGQAMLYLVQDGRLTLGGASRAQQPLEQGCHLQHTHQEACRNKYLQLLVFNHGAVARVLHFGRPMYVPGWHSCAMANCCCCVHCA